MQDIWDSHFPGLLSVRQWAKFSSPPWKRVRGFAFQGRQWIETAQRISGVAQSGWISLCDASPGKVAENVGNKPQGEGVGGAKTVCYWAARPFRMLRSKSYDLD